MSEKTLKLKRMMELVAQKEARGAKRAQQLSEINTLDPSVLRELFDDLTTSIEMLIDQHYGKLDLLQFKKQWYDISSKYEKQLSAMLDKDKPEPNEQGMKK